MLSKIRLNLPATVLLAGLALLVSTLLPATASAGVDRTRTLSEVVADHGQRSVQADCYRDVVITSMANGRYVSAELGYGGGDYAMLRARANAVGNWERFTVCIDGSTAELQSQANGRYVSAELGYGGGDYAMLRARAAVVDAWERFTIQSDGVSATIRSQANGRYVSAELGYGGGDYAMLRARATAVGPWERFRFR